MLERLGIEHLFALSGTEVLLGFLTPVAIFVVIFLAQLILPGRRVPGYVIDPATGKPRDYKLSGLLVFALALVVWALELTGMPRDWFYRSAPYAVAGGTVVAFFLTIIAVFSQPRGEVKNPIAAFWLGRAQELSFFNNRFDVKMCLYVSGGTMLALNALSAAAYHYERFGADSNPGVFLFAAFMTFYIADYFFFERVQLYTYDLIHEKLGFKLIWGALVIWGWLYVLPIWGMAALPRPDISAPWTFVLLAGTAALLWFGWGISRGANMQKYTFKRWPDRKFLGLIAPEYIAAGDRKILCNGFWGPARHFNYMGEVIIALGVALLFGHFTNPWAWVYFVYMTTYEITHQRDDERACIEKYGAEKWAEYQAKVKYRIFPGIY